MVHCKEIRNEESVMTRKRERKASGGWRSLSALSELDLGVCWMSRWPFYFSALRGGWSVEERRVCGRESKNTYWVWLGAAISPAVARTASVGGKRKVKVEGGQ
jgi:hypothetical protein